jgi:hypothetical protein
MIKKTIIVISLMLVTFMLEAKTRIAALPDLNKPEQQIGIEKDRMYVLEGTTIYIYSLKDFKLIKKFGKRGEGPREFMTSSQMGPMGALYIDVRDNKLLVKSMGKLSWFTKDGSFIKEMKSPFPIMMGALMFGKYVIIQKYEIADTRNQVLVVLNEKLEPVKEISRMEDGFQPGQGLMVLKRNPVQAVYEDKLFVAWEEEFEIKVLDSKLKELYTIKHQLERQKVTENIKKKIINFFKTSPQTKNFYELFKPIRFPSYFPAILDIAASGGKLYVLTFKTLSEDEADVQETEILIFDIKGKFLKKVTFPLKMQDPLLPYPSAIYEGTIYQIIENADEEEWEVHITEIK